MLYQLSYTPKLYGAGEGNRTLVASLEGWSFTTKLIIFIFGYNTNKNKFTTIPNDITKYFSVGILIEKNKGYKLIEKNKGYKKKLIYQYLMKVLSIKL